MSPLRLAFMGTPAFSAHILQALIDAGHDIACVYSQPPRPAGRGKKDRPSPVQKLAEQHGLEVRTPRSLKSEEIQARFAALDLDAAIVVAYGLILPEGILKAPRLGCLNLHASLLPRWRGAAPIQRAIMAGDKETGIALMQMDEGLDTGAVLAEARLRIENTDTAGSLHDRLSVLAAALIVKALPDVAAGRLPANPQAESGVTYAEKITKSEARIDWSRPAEALDRHIRGLNPMPGAFFEYQGTRIKVHEAELILNLHGAPGEILDDEMLIACGTGALRLTRLQRAGKSAMTAKEFLLGFELPKGGSVL